MVEEILTKSLEPEGRRQRENREPLKLVNLSKKELNIHQIQLLSEGLKYTPTLPQNIDKLKNDVRHFTRNIKLYEFFHPEKEQQMRERGRSLVKNKTHFNPPRNRDIILDTFKFITKFPIEEPSNNTRKKADVTNNETNAIKDLHSDMNIIIKQAEKGGAVVIVNTRDYYCNNVEEMLNVADIYVELESHDDEKVMGKIKKLTIKLILY